ncbi:hypothetical protein A2716_01635 [candidate division WWE3 bacterium RIFCSPHIGHO2_01_FULL_40_23]|uniref:Uncharacterized protein n=1 Tax=candidate division WWE3 bacterium RIFCSPLOWO2_01_FULL_41_18 TaxID=1802625 RepID=A0A1F4VEW2_UNCKA|nr:MAG: hypothetical protein A2716_01635 [candidate division WWE3 bacterium RIFCSPHIGHO2_01_FULL_40_23]OGC55695.1 MAG: hypothetical protein A3A78_01485 [candidate division WWE3 bacterium RIFCSPLOWO2_01_FULL_41_18]
MFSGVFCVKMAKGMYRWVAIYYGGYGSIQVSVEVTNSDQIPQQFATQGWQLQDILNSPEEFLNVLKAHPVLRQFSIEAWRPFAGVA